MALPIELDVLKNLDYPKSEMCRRDFGNELYVGQGSKIPLKRSWKFLPGDCFI